MNDASARPVPPGEAGAPHFKREMSLFDAVMIVRGIPVYLVRKRTERPA